MHRAVDNSDRSGTVHALRASAALSVCLVHLANIAYFDAFRAAQVFFVISGFIVPYSMTRGAYSLSAWPTFMAKRLLRLEPAYLASIALAIGLRLRAADDGVGVTQLGITFWQVASHFGYLTELTGQRWLNVVYWTLAVEFQFYLAIGALLPFLMKANPRVRLASIAAASSLPLLVSVSKTATIVYHLPVFAAGLLTFLFLRRLITGLSYWTALGALSIYLTATRGQGIALPAIGTALIIATVRMPHIRPLAWVASISYPLFLMHLPIGLNVVDFVAVRLYPSTAAALFGVTMALAASIAAATALHIAIERPFMRLASTIAYPTRPTTAPERVGNDGTMVTSRGYLKGASRSLQ